MLVSPPGMKTRARRSSIYQKGGGKLLSPSNLPVRTRRTSVYVNGKKSNLQSINEFSKVWATPVKSSVNLSPTNDLSKSSVQEDKGKTPGKKAETGSSKKSASKIKKIDVMLVDNESVGVLPTPKHKTTKTPEVKKSAIKSSIKLETPMETPSKTKQLNKILNQNQLGSLKISTPQKSFEGITGKSFYSTPKQTPVTKLPEDLIQFSTGPSKSSRRGKRVSMIVSSTVSPKSEGSAKKQYRKTPKPSKRQLEDSIDDLISSQNVKKTKTSTKNTPSRVSSSTIKRDGKAPKEKLSPIQMSAVLKSVAQNDDHLAEKISPEDQIKQTSKENTPKGMTTPIATRRGQRLQSKKLAEMVEMDQSVEEDIKSSVIPETLDTTLDLNETFNTDSRSSRCIIL